MQLYVVYNKQAAREKQFIQSHDTLSMTLRKHFAPFFNMDYTLLKDMPFQEVPYIPNSRNSPEAAAKSCNPAECSSFHFLDASDAALKMPTLPHVPSVSIHLTLLVIFSTFVRGSC